jgi:CheY-like chemotaxis protein
MAAIEKHLLYVGSDAKESLLLREAVATSCAGLLVQNAVDARAAQMHLQQIAKARVALPLDLILLDWHLPDGGARALLGFIKKQPPLALLPVVVLCRSRKMQEIEELYRFGADSYLPKPAGWQDYVELASFIARFLGMQARDRRSTSSSQGHLPAAGR